MRTMITMINITTMINMRTIPSNGYQGYQGYHKHWMINMAKSIDCCHCCYCCRKHLGNNDIGRAEPAQKWPSSLRNGQEQPRLLGVGSPEMLKNSIHREVRYKCLIGFSLEYLEALYTGKVAILQSQLKNVQKWAKNAGLLQVIYALSRYIEWPKFDINKV